MSAIRNMKAQVHSQYDVQVDDDDLESEVKDVETCLGEIVRGFGPWAWGFETGARTISCSKAKDEGGDEEYRNFCPKASAAELFKTDFARDDETAYDHWDGCKGHDRVEGLTIELNIAVDSLGVEVQGVERLNDGRDEHRQRQDGKDIDGLETQRKQGMPPAVGMRCSQDPLCEDEVYHKEKNHAGRNENLGRNCYPDVRRSIGPNDPHHAGGDASHAETEHHARHDEFMTLFIILLEDAHVCYRADQEED